MRARISYKLPATFVGFSSTDINCYRLMQAWKENEKIDFDFRDCQLHDEINSEDEAYIKSKCRARIAMASKFVQLIGQDTRYKFKYVRWEAEVALEKGCAIIGVNLDGAKRWSRAPFVAGGKPILNSSASAGPTARASDPNDRRDRSPGLLIEGSLAFRW